MRMLRRNTLQDLKVLKQMLMRSRGLMQSGSHWSIEYRSRFPGQDRTSRICRTHGLVVVTIIM